MINSKITVSNVNIYQFINYIKNFGKTFQIAICKLQLRTIFTCLLSSDVLVEAQVDDDGETHCWEGVGVACVGGDEGNDEPRRIPVSSEICCSSWY